MSTQTHYLTVVVELPSSPSAKKAVLDALPLGGQIKGARIAGIYVGDACTENERFEQLMDPREVCRIRKEARQPVRMTLEA